MKRKKRILIAPLDWGIGHATRCIPIINQLIENDFEVIIAADGRPLHLLANEFEKLEIIRLPGYNIKYPKFIPMSISMILQSPKILLAIRKEHHLLKKIIVDYNIDGVISDNRFGLYNKKIPCVFITHQLEIQSPFMKEKIKEINYNYINKYNACWVVDNKKNDLAGELSHPDDLPNNVKYIGIQSRFKKKQVNKKYDFLALVSGPEPQRTIFENGLINALAKRKEKSILLSGKPEKEENKQIGNLTIYSHLNSNELNTVILESEIIICRPGYSSLMDLQKLEKKAFLIPTPGQTEQEYLAERLFKLNVCYMQKQSEFDFDLAIKEIEKFEGFKNNQSEKINWNDLFSLF
ncbi:MAG: glycosyltransferase [Bacteroidota bacterium]|nr:glycosyltransferase [Bacteroidota bacterium]